MEININEAESILKSILRPSRFEHSVRVKETALLLNKELNLNLDKKKVMYAALLHDCAKHNEEMYFEMFKDKYCLIRENVFEIFNVSHSILGEYVAREIYNIDDDEILDAIRWHTTGKEDMSLLEKLTLIADSIEPNRQYEGLESIKSVLYEDFDKGILEYLNYQIKHLINSDVIIDIETVKARNFLQRRVNE